MRIAGIRCVGGPVEALDVDDPGPLGCGEVLIDVQCSGVGHWDNIVRDGGWNVGAAPPLALGVEAAGTIVSVGAQTPGFRIGDDVLCHPVPLRGQGTWAPRLIAPVQSLARKPSALPWEKAAIFPVPALTAGQVVDEALALRVGETLLVHGAGGITGGLIVELAGLRGVDVLATAGPGSAERVRMKGARHVIDYRDPLWPQHARALAAGPIDAAANAAPNGAAAAMEAVADGGRLATITSDPPRSSRGITVTEVYVRSDGAQLDRLTALLDSGRLTIPTPCSCRLDQAADALAHVLAGRAPSGVVITPNAVAVEVPDLGPS